MSCPRTRRFRPALESLEDRATPAGISFRNGIVSGSAFTPIEDSCPTFDEINEPCDWNIVG